MADGSQITRDDIGLTPAANDENAFIDLRRVRDEAERTAVVTALGRANGNLARAAEILGISRPTLYDIMHRVGLR
jgi:two-component system NtrC family response regulator